MHTPKNRNIHQFRNVFFGSRKYQLNWSIIGEDANLGLKEENTRQVRVSSPGVVIFCDKVVK